jgi:hypothetical protein
MDELSRRRDGRLVDSFEGAVHFLHGGGHLVVQLLAPLPLLCGAESVIWTLGSRDKHTMRVALILCVVQGSAAWREVEKEDEAVMEVGIGDAEVWHSCIEGEEVACINATGVKVVTLNVRNQTVSTP